MLNEPVQAPITHCNHGGQNGELGCVSSGGQVSSAPATAVLTFLWGRGGHGTAEMENLTEVTLLGELKARFMRDTIYTYVGEILVTVNPFKWIKGASLAFVFVAHAGPMTVAVRV